MLKKELIRKSAIKIIAREGYHNAKVQTIADEAGIANGTIYIYFKNKQEILDYIYKVEMDKKIKYLKEIKNCKGKAIHKIEKFLYFYFDEWERNSDILKITIQESVFSNMSPEIKILYDQFFQMFADLLEESYIAGEIKKFDYNFFSYIIFNSIKLAMYKCYQRSNEGLLKSKYEMEKNQYIQFIVDGIKA